MKHYLFFLLPCLYLSACSSPTYDNQAKYELAVGEKLDIYFSTNSCCQYCFAAAQNLRHIEFLEEKTLDSGPRDCAGCNFVAAYVFRAISPGIDTVQLNHSVASESCPEAEGPPEMYIVVVKE